MDIQTKIQLLGYVASCGFAFIGAFATTYALVWYGQRRKVRRGHPWEWEF